jgi:hypothetical protein
VSLGDSFGVIEGDGAGDELRWVGDAGVDVAGGPLGGGVESSEDSSEPVTETSPSPSNCGISAITDMSLVGSLGGWRWRLRFAGGAGGDGLVVVTAPAAPAAFFLAAARVSRAAATAALVVVAADAFGAAAAGAAVAADAATAA